jgi:alkanesulfonate monooxygenase SsuD/methylene tetrahydromethanopterin reductase-like flavin-dependent oxidoreductase (luciferase family)
MTVEHAALEGWNAAADRHTVNGASSRPVGRLATALPVSTRLWMLPGPPDAVARQIEAYLTVGVTHFILQLNLFNRDVMARSAEDVTPAFRWEGRP